MDLHINDMHTRERGLTIKGQFDVNLSATTVYLCVCSMRCLKHFFLSMHIVHLIPTPILAVHSDIRKALEHGITESDVNISVSINYRKGTQ